MVEGGGGVAKSDFILQGALRKLTSEEGVKKGPKLPDVIHGRSIGQNNLCCRQTKFFSEGFFFDLKAIFTSKKTFFSSHEYLFFPGQEVFVQKD